MRWTQLADRTLKSVSALNVATAFPLGLANYKFFMSGDGHSHPPFQWVESSPVLKTHFEALRKSDQLIIHVEQFQKDVSKDSVPSILRNWISQNHLFGWELEIYMALLPLMEDILLALPAALNGDGPDSHPDYQNPRRTLLSMLTDIKRNMETVAPLLPGGAAAEMTLGHMTIVQYIAYYTNLQTTPTDQVPQMETKCATFLNTYNTKAMDLRTIANPLIAAAIQDVIDKHPTKTHLITCGNAHLDVNLHTPLQNLLPLNMGQNGVFEVNPK